MTRTVGWGPGPEEDAVRGKQDAEWNKPGFRVAQVVENLPAVRETWVRSLSQEDALEEEMATHSSILAWRIPWTEEAGGLQSLGPQRAGHA